MKLQIHQAICGEKDKGWDLLGTTLRDTNTAKNISTKADQLDNPPEGTVWRAAVRGFVVDDHYVFIKTYLDTSVEVRKGRVFSHCLIILKEEVGHVNNLLQIFKLFPETLDKQPTLSVLTISTDPRKIIPITDTYGPRFNAIVNGYLSLSEIENTIVWENQDNFEEAVNVFWQYCNIKQRQTLNFGLHFNPVDLKPEDINFIAVPSNCIIKFVNRNYLVVHSNDTSSLRTLQEKYLGGDPASQKKINDFLKDFNITISDSGDLNLIAKALPTFENLDKTTDIKLLSTLSHIVEKYCPSPAVATEQKQRIIDRIIAISSGIDKAGLLLLKNFPITAFKTAKSTIITITQQWLQSRLFDLTSFVKHGKEYATIIQETLASPKRTWWDDLIKSMLSDYLKSLDKDRIKLVWAWIQKAPQVITSIAGQLPNGKEAENLFINSFPTEKIQGIQEMIAFATTRHWYRLLAKLLIHQHSFPAAVIELIKYDNDENHFDAIELMKDKATQNEVITSAITTNDSRLIVLAGEECSKSPQLLNKIDVTNPSWQKIWTFALQSGVPVGEGIKKPTEVVFRLFDQIVKGAEVETKLLSKISETSFANLLDYPARKQLWPFLSPSIKQNFLAETATHLLRQLSKSIQMSVPNDKELSAYVMANGINDFLYFNRQNIKATLPIFVRFTNYQESYLKIYLENYQGKLDSIDAEQLGQLIKDRHFRNTAYIVYDRINDFKNMKIALSHCYTLLDFMTIALIKVKKLIKNVKVSEQDWWEAFTNLSINLYPNGPHEHKVWKRSGGEEYDLQANGTGKQIWLSALQMVRQGSSNGVTIKKLFKAFENDYRYNDEIATLKQIYEKL